jgi:hypothetical protein
MMELNALEEGKAVSFSMDTVISTMMDLLQTAKIRFARANQAPRQVSSSPSQPSSTPRRP